MVHSTTQDGLSDNDASIVLWNAYRAATAAYDLVQLAPLSDSVASNLIALAKTLSVDTQAAYLDFCQSRQIGY